MKSNCFIFLIINAIAYVILFVFYQKKKRTFDIGSILIIVWIIGSVGSVYYYTFEGPYLSYDNITFPPLIYLFFINCLLFSPFLKFNYKDLRKIKTYNLSKVFDIFSVFFGIVGIPTFLNLIIQLTSFSFLGAALAEMYSSEEDSATLLFLPYIKPFYSILRHFTVFIIFLFFFQLSKQKINKMIILGLTLDLLSYLLFSFLSGSRGGILSLLITCLFFFMFMKNIIRPFIVKIITQASIILCSILIIGMAIISISRLSDMENQKGKDLLMNQWISQYAGEGIIRFDNTIWHLEDKLNGYQNLPFIFALSDSSLRDLDTYAGNAENKIKAPVTVFYTYVGDLVIDFGILGAVFAAILIFFVIKRFFKTADKSISFYHLIILSFFFEYFSIGFTANIFRTYYTQLPIVETLSLLTFIYCFQKLNEKRHAFLRNSNTSI